MLRSTLSALLVVAAALLSGCICSRPANRPCSRAAGGAAPQASASGIDVGDGVTITGQPSEDDWAAYAAAGYRTVVNFRTTREGADRERDFVVANGMQYFHVPIAGPQVTVGAADAIAAIVASPANGRVLLHCSSGNRAAGAWSVYLARHRGVGVEAALAAGARAGMTKQKVRAAARAAIERE